MGSEIIEQCLHIISRQTAMEIGLRHYFTGRPCKQGHLSLRSVGRRACLECEREYRLSRKEDIAEYKRKYHADNADRLCAKSREWYAENKERASEYSRLHYQANKSRYAERHKAWVDVNQDRKREMDRQWRADNQEAVRSSRDNWKRQNWGRVLASNRNRRSMQRMAQGTHTADDVQNLLSLQRNRCAHCSNKLTSCHVDHITPLALGGSNWPSNLQILCPTCNMQKHAKDPIEWKQQCGMLI